MIFIVLIPMVIGPKLGNLIIQNSNETFINEYSEVVAVPVPAIFLVAALFSLLVLLPLWRIIKD